jgi:deoxyribose-phosphate aldolase
MENASAKHAISRTAVLRDSVGPRVLVEAAGRFRGGDEVREAVAAGATRVSAAFSASLLGSVGEVLQPAAAGR